MAEGLFEEALRVQLCQPERCVGALTPGTWERDPIWKSGLCSCQGVNRRSPWIGMEIIQ